MATNEQEQPDVATARANLVDQLSESLLQVIDVLKHNMDNEQAIARSLMNIAEGLQTQVTAHRGLIEDLDHRINGHGEEVEVRLINMERKLERMEEEFDRRIARLG